MADTYQAQKARMARHRAKYAGREEVSPPPFLDVTCPRCVGIRGSCCLCRDSRRVPCEDLPREIGTVNVRRCDACDTCRSLPARQQKRSAA